LKKTAARKRGVRPSKAVTKRAAPATAAMPPKEQVRVYRTMVLLRRLDERMLSLQRQGRIGFYGSAYGQEAATLASAAALKPTDWIFPGLREASAMLLRGYPLVPYLAQLLGNEGDPTKGRQMPSHQASRSVNQVSWSSVIGTQLPQAVGAAHAAKLRGERAVAMAYLGDGATSSAAFHEALVFAARFSVPVVFACQNNHWSISVPLSRQTAVTELWRKGKSYGIPAERVDGNDLVAVYEASARAVERARAGRGPTFLELLTYRLGAHSTSDDPTRYRDPKEVERWLARDPLVLAQKSLVTAGLWNKKLETSLQEEVQKTIGAALAEAEAFPPPSSDTLFEDVQAMPAALLAEQRAMLSAELAEAPRAKPG
jgi:pyruvate dehydrogenase E1 component alpha subunit/2-oxoisovalerate dehydrogenase E1 component alpha subunit